MPHAFTTKSEASVALRNATSTIAVDAVTDVDYYRGVIPRDTSPEAHDAQIAGFRRLGPMGRLRAAASASDTVRKLVVAGIRRRHPRVTTRELRAELMRILYRVDATT